MARVVFVTTETIRILATSSLADSKIKSNDGILAAEWKKNAREQSGGRGFGGVKKHTGERGNNDEVQQTFSLSAPSPTLHLYRLPAAADKWRVSKDKIWTWILSICDTVWREAYMYLHH